VKPPALCTFRDRLSALFPIAYSWHICARWARRPRAVAGGLATSEGQAAATAAAALLDAQDVSARAARRATATKRRTLAEQMGGLRARVEERRAGRQHLRPLAALTLDVRRAGDLDLEVIYLVRDAAWRPLYGEELELMLGVDGLVLVRRELREREVDKRFLSGQRRVRYAYELEGRNERPTEVRLELRDQLPLSADDQVKVRLESAEPRPTEHTALGELRWQLELPPGVSRTIRFGFTIEHPAQMPLALPL